MFTVSSPVSPCWSSKTASPTSFSSSQNHSQNVGDEILWRSTKYRLVSRLGSGSSKEVFEAHRVEGTYDLPEKVAVSFWNSAEKRKISNESKALERLKDVRGVIRMLEAPISRGKVTRMITQFCEQGTVNTWAQNQSILSRLKAVLKVAKTLETLHREGKAHGDIKSENLGMTDGEPCLLDFESFTESGDAYEGEFLGSLSYAPPFTRNNWSNTPKQRDVFSLGIILFEMMGVQINMGAFAWEISRMTQRENNGYVYSYNTTQEEISNAINLVHHPAKDLLAKMLRVNPIERIKISEVIAELQAIIQRTDPHFLGILDLGNPS